MNLGNVEKLKEALKAIHDEDYQNGDLHQAILNIGYTWWQEKKNEDIHYPDMIQYMRLTYGELAAFAILCGKYNQQVENGGHLQYFDNGYAGSERRGLRSPDNDPLHQFMIRLAKSFGLEEDEIGKKVIDIWKEFELIDDGDGNFTPYRSDALDTKYYQINDAWMKHFGNLLREALL